MRCTGLSPASNRRLHASLPSLPLPAMPAASSPSYPESQKRNHTEPTAEEPGCCYDVAKRNKNKDTVTNEQARPASIDTSAVGEACGYIAVPLKFTRAGVDILPKECLRRPARTSVTSSQGECSAGRRSAASGFDFTLRQCRVTCTS